MTEYEDLHPSEYCHHYSLMGSTCGRCGVRTCGGVIHIISTTFKRLVDLENENTAFKKDIDKLIQDNFELEKKINILNEKLETLWYAPNMPAFETAKEHFEKLHQLDDNKE